jgi:hypothetical protein
MFISVDKSPVVRPKRTSAPNGHNSRTAGLRDCEAKGIDNSQHQCNACNSIFNGCNESAEQSQIRLQ